MMYSVNYSYLAKALIQILIIFSAVFSFSLESSAQVAILAGANSSYIRNDNLLENTKPIIAAHFGVSIKYYPFKKIQNLSVINEILVIRKGYEQDLDKIYQFYFAYIALPIMLNYSPVKNISLNTGIELGILAATNLEQGLITYNKFDLGLIIGFSFLEESRLSIYSRFTYGLLPMLDYYKIDKLGNFVGEIHDLKNTGISIGIKFNIYNDKIGLSK